VLKAEPSRQFAEATLSPKGDLGDSSTVPLLLALRRGSHSVTTAQQKLRRRKDAGSCNAWIARSENDGEASTSAIKQSAVKQEARG